MCALFVGFVDLYIVCVHYLWGLLTCTLYVCTDLVQVSRLKSWADDWNSKHPFKIYNM